MKSLFPWKFHPDFAVPFLSEFVGQACAALLNALNLAIYTLTICLILKVVFF